MSQEANSKLRTNCIQFSQRRLRFESLKRWQCDNLKPAGVFISLQFGNSTLGICENGSKV